MRYPFLVITFLAAGLQAALAVPLPMADVPAMAQASDLIVVGRASQTENNLAPFLVTVDRVLKGTGPPVRLVVKPVLSSEDYPAVQERQYGIFFLQRQPSGSYAVTDPFHPALVASPQQVPPEQLKGLIRAGYVYRNGDEHLLTGMGRDAPARAGVNAACEHQRDGVP
jgi:hypothetical protein